MAESSWMSLELVVPNRLGLHARAASKLVQTLAPFAAQVLMSANGREVNAKSILGVMLLAAAQGTPVRFRAEGEDAEAALAAVQALFERRFDEEG
ncbi:MAG: phosphocarrier protein HPr [Lysobacterales bacterium]|jgi:phosphocarrier protein|nr:MAG: phosphocarrier protein HPr [Xanthomonadales bacterium]